MFSLFYPFFGGHFHVLAVKPTFTNVSVYSNKCSMSICYKEVDSVKCANIMKREQINSFQRQIFSIIFAIRDHKPHEAPAKHARNREIRNSVNVN